MSAPGLRRGSRHTPAANGGKWVRPKKRLAIYLRDDLACVYCGSSRHLQLDHYVRVQGGGTNEASNLVTCCRSCNSAKGNLTARKRYAVLRKRGIAGVAARVRGHRKRQTVKQLRRSERLIGFHPSLSLQGIVAHLLHWKAVAASKALERAGRKHRLALKAEEEALTGRTA